MGQWNPGTAAIFGSAFAEIPEGVLNQLNRRRHG
jgi:hypothetical protein